MKIGILTFHRATNYGAILQAYGLVSYLQSKGFDVSVVDYKPAGMGLLYSPINVPTFYRKLKRLALNIYILPTLAARAKKRNMFWKYTENVLPLTTKVIKDDDLDNFDAIIVGSDQVWSTKFTGGLDKFYWGQFDRRGASLISYAGSAAEDMEGSFYGTNNANLLETFDSISVREDELKKYLEEKLPQKTITKVLDPTLLAGRSVFEDLIANEESPIGSYILIYQVIREKNNAIHVYAEEIAEKLGCIIYEIKHSQLFMSKYGKSEKCMGYITPTGFVNMFKYASYVITTSFHGTAFSLLFNRPFNVVSICPEVDSRAKDLLEQIGLEERLITLPQGNIWNNPIDWDLINVNLRNLRVPSESFLEKALG